MTTRRNFLQQIAAGGAGTLLAMRRGQTTAVSSADDIRVGYAAITWGGEDERAIDDIGALGFPGIQLRASVLARFGQQPAALRELLAKHGLTFVALSSGNVSIDPPDEAKVIAEHEAHAKFLHDAGGVYLQLIDERPKGRAIGHDDIRRLGRLLTEIGRRAAAAGVQAAYHPHMGSIGEKPNDIERILDATDPRYVRLLLDVAHYQAGGGDPAAAIHRHAGRLGVLHIKDLRMSPRGADGPPYEFVELGRGTVDLPGVFRALRDARFRGWAIVELDSVPDKSETPKEAAMISKRYLENIGIRVS